MSGLKESLDEDEFIAFYSSLLKRPELEEIFHKYVRNNDNGLMTAKDLQLFQKEEQKEEWSLEVCQKVIKNFETERGQNAWSSQGFANFMMFKEGLIVTDTSAVHQDMTKPLSHYWIDSSHNT